MKWSTFKAISNGTRILNHGYVQCVAVANKYHEEVLGKPFVAVASAYQWWTNYASLPALYQNYTKSSRPVPGSVVIWSGPQWNAQHGHIGVVLSVSGNTFVSLEQNVYGARWATRHSRSVYDGGLQGFLIPKNNPAVAKPAAKPTKKGLKFLTVYSRRDKYSGLGNGRTLTPGDGGFWLHTSSGRVSAASNCVGKVGEYYLTAKVTVKGTPGDRVEIGYAWQNQKPKIKRNSFNYFVSAVIGNDGIGSASLFTDRAVGSGDAVFLKCRAPEGNKGNVSVTLLNSDARLIS